MIVTILNSENQYLDFDTDNISQYGSSTGIFKLCEKMFWNWFNSANPADELEEKYFGEERIYIKKGAILQLIESMAEYCEDNPSVTLYTEKQILAADIDATLA